MRNTVALVLAGGVNVGYSVLTHNRAKSALPFFGHFRLVDFVLTNLSRSGVNNVGVIIQYLPGSLIDHIAIGRAWDFDSTNRRIKLMPPFVGMGRTDWYRGSADAIYRNMDFIQNNRAHDVLVVCADHVYCMDYRPMLNLHRERGADITIMTTQRPEGTDPRHYGYVTVGDRGRVTDFIEKPSLPPAHDVVSTGVYLFRADLLCDRLYDMQRLSSDHHLPTVVVEPIVREGRAFAWPFEDDWHYLPDIESYVEFHQRLLRGESTISPDRDSVLTDLRDRDLGSRPAPYFGPLSEVEDSLVSPGCVVEGKVVRSVLSPGVHVAPKAVVRDSILFHDCFVGQGARLEGVVSDKDVRFDPFCRVGTPLPDPGDIRPGQLTVVGKGARIVQGVAIEAGREVPIRQVVTREWDGSVQNAAVRL
jgi:glucose-1-phosphate adenylyltransferase